MPREKEFSFLCKADDSHLARLRASFFCWNPFASSTVRRTFSCHVLRYFLIWNVFMTRGLWWFMQSCSSFFELKMLWVFRPSSDAKKMQESFTNLWLLWSHVMFVWKIYDLWCQTLSNNHQQTFETEAKRHPEYLKQETPRHFQHLLAQVCHLKHEILCDNSFFLLFDELVEEFLPHILFSQRRQQKQRMKLLSHAKD